MIISKPLAAILGFIPKGCAHQPQPAKQALANEVKEYRAKSAMNTTAFFMLENGLCKMQYDRFGGLFLFAVKR